MRDTDVQPTAESLRLLCERAAGEGAGGSGEAGGSRMVQDVQAGAVAVACTSVVAVEGMVSSWRGADRSDVGAGEQRTQG